MLEVVTLLVGKEAAVAAQEGSTEARKGGGQLGWSQTGPGRHFHSPTPQAGGWRWRKKITIIPSKQYP